MKYRINLESHNLLVDKSIRRLSIRLIDYLIDLLLLMDNFYWVYLMLIKFVINWSNLNILT